MNLARTGELRLVVKKLVAALVRVGLLLVLQMQLLMLLVLLVINYGSLRLLRLLTVCVQANLLDHQMIRSCC